MPRVVLLVPTTTYRATDFLRAAHAMQVDVTVASEEPSTLESLAPDALLTIQFADPTAAVRQVVEFSRRHPIDAVVGVDDQVSVVAAEVSRALSLPHNPPQAVAAARNKLLMREALARSNVLSPAHRAARFGDDIDALAGEVRFPCVVKPVDLAGSRGVIRADSPEELVMVIERVGTIVAAATGRAADDQSLVVEDYIDGPEYALEGILTAGELRVLAIFDKPDPLVGPYFEETIYVTPSRLDTEARTAIASATEDAARALGLREGPVHAELRIDGRGAWLIEINPRSIGGLCSRVLRFGTGISLEQLIIAHALGMSIDELEREERPAGVMMIPAPATGTLLEVVGVDEARSIPGIDEVAITARPGQKLVTLPEESNYAGFIFARGDTPREVELALREAFALIRFNVDWR